MSSGTVGTKAIENKECDTFYKKAKGQMHAGKVLLSHEEKTSVTGHTRAESWILSIVHFDIKAMRTKS